MFGWISCISETILKKAKHLLKLSSSNLCIWYNSKSAMMSQTSWHFACQTAFAVLTLVAIEKDYSLPTYDTNCLDSAMHSILTATWLMPVC